MLRFCLLALVLGFASCKEGKDKPDVSSIRADVRLTRFEQDFFRLDTLQLAAALTGLRTRYPDLYPVFMDNLLGLEPVHRVEADGRIALQPEGEAAVRQFLQYHRFLYDSLEARYRDLGWLKNDLDQALRYVRFYYPSFQLPTFTTYIGPLNSPGTIAVQDRVIGIGLHQYAGKEASIYQAPEILEMYPFYISRRFDREYMLPNCLKGVVSIIYPDSSRGLALVEQMVEKGKEWYLLDKFLPDTEDSLKTGFTQAQLNWCQEYEGTIWSQITRAEDLYTIDPTTIQNYIGPAPFTQGMPQEASPGNLGQWVGWRIVQKFAERNPDLSLQQVLATPARRLFTESRYKPK